MEPISHEGLGRLLKLDSNLQTPHIVFSQTELSDSGNLETGGTI